MKGKEPIMLQMKEGMFYGLNPPAMIGDKIFHKVQCEYQVPRRPNEFVVKGIPQGATEIESFVLRFTPNGRVRPLPSSEQNF